MPTLKESNDLIGVATFKEGKTMPTSKESNDLIEVATFKEGREMATSGDGVNSDVKLMTTPEEYRASDVHLRGGQK